MKILVDATGVVSGGVLRVLTETLTAWQPEDEIHVAGGPEVCRAVALLPVSSHAMQGTGRASQLGAAVPRLVALSRHLAPDRVLSFSPSLPGALLEPDVTVLHDLFFRLWPVGVPRSVRSYRTVSYVQALKRSRVIACVSERTRHDLRGWMPTEAGRARLWRLAAAPCFMSETRARRESETPYVVVPAHNDYKGAELAVGGLARVKGPQVILLAGSSERAELLTDRFRHSEHPVLARGSLPDSELVDLIHNACALVMPSHIEGAGLPVLEALALGTPVITSPDPALVETGGGFPVVMQTWTDAAMAQAFDQCLAVESSHWKAARAWARSRRWADCARELRAMAEH